MSYPCAYCGKTMEKYGGDGPNIHYAQCWDCALKKVLKERDAAWRALNRWHYGAIILAAAVMCALIVYAELGL